jgi:transcriptional regulator with XRE-family HTH domain
MNDKPLIKVDKVCDYPHEFISKFSANVLKSARNVRGISQKKIAEKSGYTFQQQQKYEKGINLMRSGNVFLQACYLGIPINLCFPQQIFRSDNSTIYNFIDGRYQYPEINLQNINKYRKIYEISLMLSVIENESAISSIYNETARLLDNS